MKKIRLLGVFLFVKDLENTRDYEIESANGIEIRGVLEEKGEKVKITLFGKLEVPGDTNEPRNAEFTAFLGSCFLL